MTKIYKLLIESPEIPKGSFAVFKDEYIAKTYYSHDMYYVFYPDDSIDNIKLRRGVVYKEVIENRPSVWELQEEKLDLRSPEAERMREEARSKRWEFVPEEGYIYYMYSLLTNTINSQTMTSADYHCGRWNMGNCHRTNLEALAWGKKYARYFLTE